MLYVSLLHHVDAERRTLGAGKPGGNEHLMADEHGLGKCERNHVGSYGYPTRPEKPYGFCPVCGKRMVWACTKCCGAAAEW